MEFEEKELIAIDLFIDNRYTGITNFCIQYPKLSYEIENGIVNLRFEVSFIRKSDEVKIAEAFFEKQVFVTLSPIKNEFIENMQFTHAVERMIVGVKDYLEKNIPSKTIDIMIPLILSSEVVSVAEHAFSELKKLV